MSDRDLIEDEMPRVELRDPVPTEMALLRALQRAMLTHPVAAQTAFTALMAEGRRFGETPDGRRWKERLVKSALLQQACYVFDLTTLGMLEEQSGSSLPSSYLDALFMVAASGDADALLNQLFWSGDDRDADGN